MSSQITRFQKARWCVLASLLLLAVSLGMVLLDSRSDFPSASYFWWAAVPGSVLALLGQLGYRCPSCRKFPEKSDVPTFNPEECEHCGARLK